MLAKRKSKVTKMRRRSKDNGPNPVFKKGERNLFCPNYCQCLDFAIHKSWEFWACFECRHKGDVQMFDNYPATNNDAVLYHTLPQEYYLRVG